MNSRSGRRRSTNFRQQVQFDSPESSDSDNYKAYEENDDETRCSVFVLFILVVCGAGFALCSSFIFADSTMPGSRRCKSCYTPREEPVARLTFEQATDVLVRQQLAQQAVIDECGGVAKCFDTLPPLQANLNEYSAASQAGAVLGWVAAQPDAADILEIGASYGGGSTAVLAHAAASTGHSVTSIEAVKEKFLQGLRYYHPFGRGNATTTASGGGGGGGGGSESVEKEDEGAGSPPLERGEWNVASGGEKREKNEKERRQENEEDAIDTLSPLPRLPVRLLYGSSVSVRHLPTDLEYAVLGDPRPLKWLRNERRLAASHGFGILAALLKIQWPPPPLPSSSSSSSLAPALSSSLLSSSPSRASTWASSTTRAPLQTNGNKNSSSSSSSSSGSNNGNTESRDSSRSKNSSLAGAAAEVMSATTSLRGLRGEGKGFGLVFVDGGAFTGPAEWAAIQGHLLDEGGGGGGGGRRNKKGKSEFTPRTPSARQPEGVARKAHLRWLVLDDTHAKTTALLLRALQGDPKRASAGDEPNATLSNSLPPASLAKRISSIRSAIFATDKRKREEGEVDEDDEEGAASVRAGYEAGRCGEFWRAGAAPRRDGRSSGRRQRRSWGVVYEELNEEGLKVFESLRYSTKGGHHERDHRRRRAWWRASKGRLGRQVVSHLKKCGHYDHRHHKNKKNKRKEAAVERKREFRNFAVLRRFDYHNQNQNHSHSRPHQGDKSS